MPAWRAAYGRFDGCGCPLRRPVAALKLTSNVPTIDPQRYILVSMYRYHIVATCPKEKGLEVKA